MVTLSYICHPCNIVRERTVHESDAFYPVNCTECGRSMQRTTEKHLLETWPAPRFEPPEAA
jgi:hypothetical protein